MTLLRGDFRQVVLINKQYKKIRAQLRSIKRNESIHTAVVLHLFYTDTWEIFRTALHNIAEPFDLFVSIPSQNLGFVSEIKKEFQGSHIYEVPNRGRDILPFLQIASELEALGYLYVLKIHSKKSAHRTDGQNWMANIVHSLLSNKTDVLPQAQKILQRPSASLIGPQGEYISLLVNFEANGSHMTRIISELYDPKTSHQVLQLERSRHGFIAGTMFWARLDALRPILSRDWSISNFEIESGQIDTTFAHAMERVLSLVPQIEGKDIFEMGSKGVKKLEYKTSNIPDWSDVYIGPKPVRRQGKKKRG